MHFYMLSQGYEPASSESLKMYESDPERVFRDEVAPPSPPTPHLGFTMQKKLVRQIEELRGNGETVSDAATQQTISRTFPPLIQNLVMILPSFPRSFRLIH